MRIFRVVVLMLMTFASAVHAAPDTLTLVVPAGSGGSWEKLARAIQRALGETRLVAHVDVENHPGEGGIVGLRHVANLPASAPPTLLVAGLSLLGAILVSGASDRLSDVKPLARIDGEVQAAVVAANGRIASLTMLGQAFRADPASIRWGGAAPGSAGQMALGFYAQTLSVPPASASYRGFATVAESAQALLDGKVDVLVSSYAEFVDQIKAGHMRPLGLTSLVRLPATNIPTFMEQGVPVELLNWNGLFTPPSMSTATRDAIEAVVAAMVRTPEWSARLDEFHWLDSFAASENFAAFLGTETPRIAAILHEQGLR